MVYSQAFGGPLLSFPKKNYLKEKKKLLPKVGFATT